MMARRGYHCCVFLDDFLLYEQSFDKCKLALSTLISLLRSLGFRINWKKVCDPCRCLVFLGIQIDLDAGTLNLDPDKQHKLITFLKDITHRKRISKHTLQVVAGKCTWAANVIRHGRAHMNSFFHSIRYLKQNDHKLRLTPTLLQDIRWWVTNLQTQRPTRAIWPETQLLQQPAVHIATDASLVAGGAFLRANRAWIYRNWLLDKPEVASHSITVKELAMIHDAIETWAPLHPHHHFLVECDNLAAVHMTNSGATRHYRAAQLLRCMADTALKYDITITANHIRGTTNDIPDSISRLHAPGQLIRLSSHLRNLYHPLPHPTYCLLNHMSYLSYLFLLPQVLQHHRIPLNWITRLPSSAPIASHPPQQQRINLN